MSPRMSPKPALTTRRKFIATSTAALAAPHIRAQSKTALKFHGSLVGPACARRLSPLRLCQPAVIHGRRLFSGVCFGAKPDDYRMWQGRGFVTILDEADKVVSNPGGEAPIYGEGPIKVMLQAQPVLNTCHDVCVDKHGDLYVCQWNSGGVYPYKLCREA